METTIELTPKQETALERLIEHLVESQADNDWEQHLPEMESLHELLDAQRRGE